VRERRTRGGKRIDEQKKPKKRTTRPGKKIMDEKGRVDGFKTCLQARPACFRNKPIPRDQLPQGGDHTRLSKGATLKPKKGRGLTMQTKGGRRLVGNLFLRSKPYHSREVVTVDAV